MGKTSNGAGCGLELLALKFPAGEGWPSAVGSGRGFPVLRASAVHGNEGGNLLQVFDGEKGGNFCRNPAGA